MAKQGFNKHNLKERTGKKSEEDTNTQKNLIKPTTKVSTLPGGRTTISERHGCSAGN